MRSRGTWSCIEPHSQGPGPASNHTCCELTEVFPLPGPHSPGDV